MIKQKSRNRFICLDETLETEVFGFRIQVRVLGVFAQNEPLIFNKSMTKHSATTIKYGSYVLVILFHLVSASSATNAVL